MDLTQLKEYSYLFVFKRDLTKFINLMGSVVKCNVKGALAIFEDISIMLSYIYLCWKNMLHAGQPKLGYCDREKKK